MFVTYLTLNQCLRDRLYEIPFKIIAAIKLQLNNDSYFTSFFIHYENMSMQYSYLYNCKNEIF